MKVRELEWPPEKECYVLRGTQRIMTGHENEGALHVSFIGDVPYYVTDGDPSAKIANAMVFDTSDQAASHALSIKGEWSPVEVQEAMFDALT